jgi:hypothetical protein
MTLEKLYEHVTDILEHITAALNINFTYLQDFALECILSSAQDYIKGLLEEIEDDTPDESEYINPATRVRDSA